MTEFVDFLVNEFFLAANGRSFFGRFLFAFFTVHHRRKKREPLHVMLLRSIPLLAVDVKNVAESSATPFLQE